MPACWRRWVGMGSGLAGGWVVWQVWQVAWRFGLPGPSDLASEVSPAAWLARCIPLNNLPVAPTINAQVAAGEAVHAFASWRDLKGRLDANNRR